jgi:cytochrome c nitrite reductase small subunit
MQRSSSSESGARQPSAPAGEPGAGRPSLAVRAARHPAAALTLAVMLGVAAGVGGYTFRYAEGFSYFSTDPTACVNCHIMEPQYDAWQKASHHAVAVCVDCHLPTAFVPKYLAKAENGWRHGKLFTTQSFREPIVVKSEGLAILESNCQRCHGRLVAQMAGLDPVDAPESPLPHYAPGQTGCLHCHSSVGHGVKAGLGGPLREEEIRALEPSAGPTASKASMKGSEP